jgi:drug/metabolite transporter (DMT)-like permease
MVSVTAAALLWSSSYAVTKQVLRETNPLTIGAVRFCLAAVVLGVLVRSRRGRAGRGGRTGDGGRPGPTGIRQRRLIRLSGLIGITVYFVLENYGVQLSNASDASLIVATYPLMTMLVEMAVQRRAVMPRLRVAGVLLAGIGAILVVRNGAEAGGTARWAGDMLLLLGGLAWGCYSVLGKRIGDGENALDLTFRQTCAGAAGFVVIALPALPGQRMPSGTDVLLLVYLALACSVGGFLLYNHGLRQMPSSVAVNILNLVPVFGVAGAVLIDGERVEPVQLFGGAVIVLGVALGLLERRRAPAESPSAASHLQSDGELDSPCRTPAASLVGKGDTN